MILRPYQNDISTAIDKAWASGAQNVCATLATGGGKTIIFSNKIASRQGVVFAIAHRQELIVQMSMTLCKAGVTHSVQAPINLTKYIITEQIRKFRRRFEDPRSKVIVTGVLTLLNRERVLRHMIDRAELWVIDEAAHVIRDNVWGQAVQLFPKTCLGLGVTATPERSDGKGIGREGSGVFDVLVTGPSMRKLINDGYLTDYRIFGPYSDINLSNVPISRTGDYSQPKLVAAVRKSKIVGDIVQSYLKFTPGKIGVTFVTDVETAEEIATAYTAAGVPSRSVHAKTPDRERQQSTEMLRRGELKNLVNVDIFGEGFDLPAIEVVSMARPTESYPLHTQQFGRGLRIMDGKPYGTIIDHVGNVKRHGLPDREREWSLADRESRKSDRDPDLVPIRTCRQCLAVYESYNHNCPFCGWIYVTDARGSVEQVEGDLCELSPELLAAMRGEIERIDSSPEAVGDRMRHAGAPLPAVMGAMKNHRLRQEAQVALRESIAIWAGYYKAAGISDSEAMKRFYRLFGTDVMTAQTLGRTEATELKRRIYETIR